MKIERDKVYLTRCGTRMRIICTDAPSKNYPVIGMDEEGSTYTYDSEGAFVTDKQMENDLVSEYVEPPKPREVWVNVASPNLAGYAWYERELNDLDGATLAKLVKFREVIEA